MSAKIKAKISTKELKKFKLNLERLNEKQRTQWSEKAVRELASRLLRRVIRRTPKGKIPKLDRPKKDGRKVKAVGMSGKTRSFLTSGEAAYQKIYQQYWAGYQGGTLRGAWDVGEVKKIGDAFTIEVYNPKDYAEYVEFGHRQTPGRFVPALGKRLVKGWVNGKFMLTVSEAELEADAPGVLTASLDRFMKEVFK